MDRMHSGRPPATTRVTTTSCGSSRRSANASPWRRMRRSGIARRIDHCACPYDVVDDDQAAPPCELERPGEVFGSAHLVGVDEYDVERAEALGGESRQGLERLAQAQVDDIGQSGTRDVGPGDL